MNRCRFTGAGWYTLLWRSYRDPTGTRRQVRIEALDDPELPGLLGVWTMPAVAGDAPILIARITHAACERNLISRLK